MQITLTVPDAKADSFLDVLRHISYVEISASDTLDNSYSAYEEDDEDEEEKISAEDFYESLRRSVHEVNEAIAGRLQLQSFDEFIDELRGEAVARVR